VLIGATNMDPDIIRRIEAAAALRDKTAIVVLEKAARSGWIGIRTESSRRRHTVRIVV
jgi:hypothetical protein